MVVSYRYQCVPIEFTLWWFLTDISVCPQSSQYGGFLQTSVCAHRVHTMVVSYRHQCVPTEFTLWWFLTDISVCPQSSHYGGFLQTSMCAHIAHTMVYSNRVSSREASQCNEGHMYKLCPGSGSRCRCMNSVCPGKAADERLLGGSATAVA